MVKIANLSKIYDKKVKALNNINLHIKPGEFVSIVGQSGSGKSTLIKLLIAEEKPDKGSIILGGWDITHIKNREVPTLRRQIGVISQMISLVGLKGMEERYPHQLSGGEQQRVAIARALVHKPKLLVADEPTGNLDSINTREIIDLLKKINNLGTTVLLVTHDREVVNNLKGRVITLDSGHMISDQKHGRYLL